MAGIAVNRNVFDQRLGEAALELRSVFDRVENISSWLANHPGSGPTDPLVTDFGYTEDEAYVIRVIFEGFEALRTNNDPLFDLTHKLTGLD